MKNYDHKIIEPKWQKYWEDKKLFAAKDKSSKPKYYCLVEFPYPSGDGLHVGHPKSYTALDILARKKRMEGFNVLYPMGFDAFGLPSENYAIKTGIHPAITTQKNIDTFKNQLKSLGLSFDWDREVVTTDPSYYRWTQWIFLKMHEKGLAYKDKMTINWCPSCKIGLANEEVINGNCERCGHQVEKKEKEQWMLRITNYADRLIDDLALVDYPQRVATQQINWIGRSEGVEIDFPLDGHDEILTVYTTRPDTLFGATFLVIAPEHPLTEVIATAEKKAEVLSYVKKSKNTSDLERTDFTRDKTGVFTGAFAVNPVTNKKIPVWVADYVLMNYGTGAIMSVPAHDSRDFAFAKKYDLPIVKVIEPESLQTFPRNAEDLATGASTELKVEADCFEGKGKLINSGQFSGMNSDVAFGKIIEFLENKNLGRFAVNYKIRDWVFSRQRYWGEPIPMIYCGNCRKTGAAADGWVRVPEKQLPVRLPEVEKYEPTATGESPLASITDWVNVECPVCGSAAKRETDTMPNWAGSNWYFLRYIDPRNKKALVDKKKLEYFMPVDWYNGGMEHTTLHLLYSRFVYKFLYDINAVPQELGPEPYKKRTSHGLILGAGGEKMSKSKGNVINPNDIVKEFGADTLRVYEMFMGPFDQAIPWDVKGVVGVRRFLEKVWTIFTDQGIKMVDQAGEELTALTHKSIKKVGNDIETQNYNTAVSAMMILVNKILEKKEIDRFIADSFLKILYPFAPHICEELWQITKHKKSLTDQSWPAYDEAYMKESEIELIVQVNGKVRDKIRVPVDITEQMAEKLSRESAKVSKYLSGQTVKNIIFVPGRLINFVV